MPNSPLATNALFSGISPEALERLREAATEIKFARGDALVKQGDQADRLYFIQAGRFKIVINDALTVAHVDAGEVVGELAFFAGGSRTADVIATRDATVLEITRRDFDRISAAHTELPQLLLRLVSERLAQTTRRTSAVKQNIPRVIGLLPIGNAQISEGFADQLCSEMLKLTHGHTPVIVARESVISHPSDYSNWLAEHESDGTFILVDCRGSNDWVQQASRNVDALLLLAHNQAGHTGVHDHEQQAANLLSPHNRNIVIVRDQGNEPIRASANWLDQREFGLHHHLALDKPADFARLARFIMGKANGLVLAGGGALGCAHLGAIKALQAANIPLDYFGGASAGAAMAAAIAMGKSCDDTLDQMETMFVEARALKRLTIPIHSLLDPSEFDHQLQTRYGYDDIADLQSLFFAVSTNLSTSAQEIHQRGPIWEAVRASGSLPTILPPFIDAKGNILVDGGVLDNLPVSTMVGLKHGPNIAISLDALDESWHTDTRYDQVRGRAALLRDIALRRSPKHNFPTLFETTQRSMVVTSRIASRDIDDASNIVITPPKLANMQILDWHRGRELAEQTERYVSHLIENEPERFGPLSVN